MSWHSKEYIDINGSGSTFQFASVDQVGERKVSKVEPEEIYAVLTNANYSGYTPCLTSVLYVKVPRRELSQNQSVSCVLSNNLNKSVIIRTLGKLTVYLF